MKQSKHFEDIADCIEYASQPLVNYSGARTSNRALQGVFESGWCNTPDFPAAAQLARVGWPEGLAKVKPFAERLTGKLASRIQRETYEPAIQGLFFDIGLVLSGEPECWLEQAHTEQEGGAGNKVVTISVAISAAGHVSAKALEQRGATVMALVQLLELAGKSVRVVGILGAHWKSNICDSTLVLKQASQPLNADQLAFWLVSPDALRRMAFAVREVITDGKIISDAMGAQCVSQHVADADIKVNRLDEDNYRHGFSEAGFERQLIEWLQAAGVSVDK